MELVVLGSGTAVPAPGRGAPGYLLRAGDVNLLLDCGPGSVREAARAGVGPESVHGVLLTHFHTDHVNDLPALLFALRNPRYRGRPSLTLAGPKGLSELVTHWESGPQGRWLRADGYERHILELAEGRHDLLGLPVQAAAVPHAPESLAYRIGDGPCLVYSGDTGPGEEITRLALRADLLLLECSFPDSAPSERHLTPSSAGRVAGAAQPGRLVLTHFYPSVEGEPIEAQVGRHYSGRVDRAKDGAVYPIGPPAPARTV